MLELIAELKATHIMVSVVSDTVIEAQTDTKSHSRKAVELAKKYGFNWRGTCCGVKISSL